MFDAALHVTKELTSLLPDESGLLCRSPLALFVPVHGRHVYVRHADVGEEVSLVEVFAEVGICEADVVSYTIHKSTINIKLYTFTSKTIRISIYNVNRHMSRARKR